MSTILTDDEFPPLQPQDHPEPHSFAWTEQEMRAIRARDRLVEAAVLAKLREQEPKPVYLDNLIDRLLMPLPSMPASEVEKLMAEAAQMLHLQCHKRKAGAAAPLPAVVQVPLPERETTAMHDAVMMVLYNGVTRGNTDALWQAYRRVLLAAAPEAPAQGMNVDDLRDRLMSISSAVADDDHRAAQSMIGETLRMLDSPEAPAQSDPLEKLTRIQEELGLYNDKPAQGETAFPINPPHATGDEAWIVSAGGRCAAFVSEEDADEWLEGQGLMPFGQQQDYTKKLLTEAQADMGNPISVPAPWREAVKVAREALEEAAQMFDQHDAALEVITAALAQLDALEGGE